MEKKGKRVEFHEVKHIYSKIAEVLQSDDLDIYKDLNWGLGVSSDVVDCLSGNK